MSVKDDIAVDMLIFRPMAEAASRKAQKLANIVGYVAYRSWSQILRSFMSECMCLKHICATLLLLGGQYLRRSSRVAILGTISFLVLQKNFFIKVDLGQGFLDTL